MSANSGMKTKGIFNDFRGLMIYSCAPGRAVHIPTDGVHRAGCTTHCEFHTLHSSIFVRHVLPGKQCFSGGTMNAIVCLPLEVFLEGSFDLLLHISGMMVVFVVKGHLYQHPDSPAPGHRYIHSKCI